MNLDQSLASLRQLVAHLHAKSQSTEHSSADFRRVIMGGTYFTRAPYGGLALIDDELKSYRNCLHDISEIATKKGLISRSAVESHVQLAILKALDINGIQASLDFDKRLSGALVELKKSLLVTPQRWELHLQVLGLSAKGLPYKFGACEFYLADEARIKHIHEKINGPGGGAVQMAGGADTQPDWGLAQLKRVMIGGTWCTIHVDAIDKEAALVLAERHLRLTIDVINFYAEVTVGRARIFLPGDAGPSRRRGLRIPSDGSAPDITQTQVGPLEEFSVVDIPEAMAQLLELVRVSSWLEKSKPSELEDRILSALQWAGRAGIADRREEAFLLYTIAMESLLLGGRSNTEITEKFALRGAHLLSSDLDARKNVYKDLKELYGIRSAIVHSGSLEVTDDELSRIAAVARGALVSVLHLPPFLLMTAESEFEEWFKDQLLGASQIPYEKPQSWTSLPS